MTRPDPFRGLTIEAAREVLEARGCTAVRVLCESGDPIVQAALARLRWEHFTLAECGDLAAATYAAVGYEHNRALLEGGLAFETDTIGGEDW